MPNQLYLGILTMIKMMMLSLARMVQMVYRFGQMMDWVFLLYAMKMRVLYMPMTLLLPT